TRSSAPQRASLLEFGTPPREMPGQVVWRVDSANIGQNQPLDTVVRADVEIPGPGLTLAFIVRRNTDPKLSASHTIAMRFGKMPGGEGRTVKDVGLPQFKSEEGAKGVALEGVPAPVEDNFFLIGLWSFPADMARNIELMRTKNWIDIPLVYEDGRKAVIG